MQKGCKREMTWQEKWQWSRATPAAMTGSAGFAGQAVQWVMQGHIVVIAGMLALIAIVAILFIVRRKPFLVGVSK
jgi:predicted RND superfamily exporter protein